MTVNVYRVTLRDQITQERQTVVSADSPEEAIRLARQQVHCAPRHYPRTETCRDISIAEPYQQP